MHLPHLVGFPAVIEDPLRHGRLAGVDVGDDADVADGAGVMLHHDAVAPFSNLVKYTKRVAERNGRKGNQLHLVEKIYFATTYD